MIDLHCHILPGLDDGARDLADALEMIRRAAANGISTICATPHIRPDHHVKIDELPNRVAELSRAVSDSGGTVRIVSGGEVASSMVEELDDLELRAVTLGRGRWILLEPPPGRLDDRLDRAVANLHERGFGALIAHPERHLAPDLVARLRSLTAQGALVQATAAFFTEQATREGMIHLAKEGVIHVLGSDAHSALAGRPMDFAGALSVLSSVIGVREHTDWIVRTAPEAIVAGREIRPPF